MSFTLLKSKTGIPATVPLQLYLLKVNEKPEAEMVTNEKRVLVA